MTKYTITVTEKQLNTIGLACEVYGRLQYGQMRAIADIVPINAEKFDPWTLGDHLDEMAEVYLGDIKRNENGTRECDVALDMWRNIIRNDDFCMSSEPKIKIEKVDER